MSTSIEAPTDELRANRSKILDHFSGSINRYKTGWEELWTESLTPWDRPAGSNPALVDLLDSFDISSPSGNRKRALVPGCGRGYDVVLFASHGVEGYGLDVAPTAVKAATKYAAEHSQEARASTKFVVGDFYTDDFLEEMGVRKGGFDYIYDYTFLCAMHPSMRPAWAQRMAELLQEETGQLICLEYPLYKAPETGGPPFGLTSYVYDELLGGVGLEKMRRFKPERTHKVGEGSDMVSIWEKPKKNV